MFGKKGEEGAVGGGGGLRRRERGGGRDGGLIGRVRKIAVEIGRPSTSRLITGRSQVPTCAGSSESDHSGVTPVEIHWSVTSLFSP